MRRNCNEIENGLVSAGGSSGAKLAEGRWSSRGREWLRDQMLLRKGVKVKRTLLLHLLLFQSIFCLILLLPFSCQLVVDGWSFSLKLTHTHFLVSWWTDQRQMYIATALLLLLSQLLIITRQESNTLLTLAVKELSKWKWSEVEGCLPKWWYSNACRLAVDIWRWDVHSRGTGTSVKCLF